MRPERIITHTFSLVPASECPNSVRSIAFHLMSLIFLIKQYGHAACSLHILVSRAPVPSPDDLESFPSKDGVEFHHE